jgi:hypothetical protein
MSATGRGAIQNAMLLRKDIQIFLSRWPSQSNQEDWLPSLSWTQLQRQIEDLATTPSKKAMVASLISATRKQARFKPPEMVMREILCIAAVLMDETFDPQGTEGAMT